MLSRVTLRVFTFVILYAQTGTVVGENRSGQSAYQTITAREYLVRHESETEGYRLYSYIIFTRRPDTEYQLKRYLALFRAYRSAFEFSDEFFELGYDSTQLNIMYWLLKKSSSESISPEDELTEMSYFVINYDYARAQSILRRFQLLNEEGPYILTYVAPILKQNFKKKSARNDILLTELHNFLEDDFHKVFQFFKGMGQNPETWRDNFDLVELRSMLRNILRKIVSK